MYRMYPEPPSSDQIQIREMRREIEFLRLRLFGDSREANAESMYRTIQETKVTAEQLKLELARLRLWNVVLSIGFVTVVVILVIILYLIGAVT